MWIRAIRGRLACAPAVSVARGCPKRSETWRLALGSRNYFASNTRTNTVDDEEIGTVESSRGRGDDAAQSLSQHSRDAEGDGGEFSHPRKELNAKDIGNNVSRKVIEMELKWLKDPRALADRVGRLLMSGDAHLAVALVREAQRTRMECSVAWNHVLDHFMKDDNPKAAFSLYNEMKKRGRRPNSRTYTIMLNGFSNTFHTKPVPLAYSIYKSIFSSNSVVKPNIIHSNAMLNVCLKHGDMDTLWEVAGDLPEEGPEAPDAMTYAIILQAVENSLRADVAKMNPKDIDGILERKAQGVREGKRVWSDIVVQWKKGNLPIDGHLVYAMASLLIEGSSERDCYDALALYHQTAGVPIMANEPADTYRKGGRSKEGLNRSRDERRKLDYVPFVYAGGRLMDKEATREEDKEEEEEEEEEENFDGLFDPVVSADAGGSSAPQRITPGNRELTMILLACRTMTQAIGAGKAYWQYFTEDLKGPKLEPDTIACHEYLRLLRIARSSRAAVDLIRDQMAPTRIMEGKTFHIALSVCRRDRKNINVFKNANELLKLMDTNLSLPDPRAIVGYHDFVEILLDNPGQLMHINGLDSEGRPSRHLGTEGRKLQFKLRMAAVTNLRPLFTKLHEAMKSGRTEKSVNVHWGKNLAPHAVPGPASVVALTRTRALIDELLKPGNRSFLTTSDRKILEKEAKQLSIYSKPEMGMKYKDSQVYPTREQDLEFRKRLENLSREFEKRLNADNEKGREESGSENAQEKQEGEAEEEKA